MIRKLLKDSVLYSISSILSRGIGIIMVPIYTSILMPKDYGIVDMLTIFGAVLAIFLNLEIHQAVARFYPDASSPEEKKKIVSTAFWFVLVSYALFNLLAFFIYPELTSVILEDAKYVRIFQFGIWAVTLNFIFYFLQSQLVWQLLSRQNAIAAITYTFLTAGLTVTFLYVFRMGVVAVFLGQSIAASIACLLSFRFARHSYAFVFDVITLKRLLKFSLPLVPASLAVYGMFYIDRYVINHFLTLNEVGLYGIAYKVASILGLLTFGVHTALTPLIYNHYQDPETPGKIAQLFRYFCFAGFTAIIALSLFAREILILFTQPAYYDAAILVPFLLVAFFFTNLLNFSPGIFIKNRTMIIVYINAAMFGLNFLGNVVLVKSFGAPGAAFATMLTSLFYFGLYLVIGNKLYPIPHKWMNLLFSFVCVACVLLIIYVVPLNDLWSKSFVLISATLIMLWSLAKKADFQYCFDLIKGKNA